MNNEAKTGHTSLFSERMSAAEVIPRSKDPPLLRLKFIISFWGIQHYEMDINGGFFYFLGRKGGEIMFS